MRRIIFITEWQFNERDYNRYGVTRFVERGFLPEIWDITKLRQSNFNSSPSTLLPGKCLVSRKQFHEELRTLDSQDLILPLIGLGTDTFGLFKMISRAKARYAVICVNLIPLAQLPQTTGERISKPALRLVRLLGDPKRIRSLWRMLNLWFTRSADYALLGGKQSETAYRFKITRQTKKIWCHSFDYDQTLAYHEPLANLREPFAVFIDQNIPFHPEYFIEGIKPYAEASSYYGELDRFFDYVKKTFGWEVIVAAHPTSDSNTLARYLPNRRIVKGETLKYISLSSCVFVHSSTSVGYAICKKKPIVFIATDSLMHSEEASRTRIFARALSKKPFNISGDDFEALREEIEVDEAKYEAYIENFVKRPFSEKKYFWDIFLDAIKADFALPG